MCASQTHGFVLFHVDIVDWGALAQTLLVCLALCGLVTGQNERLGISLVVYVI